MVQGRRLPRCTTATKPCLTVAVLIEICDAVRASFRHGEDITFRAAQAKDLIEGIYQSIGQPDEMGFDTIRDARLDKLLSEMTSPSALLSSGQYSSHLDFETILKVQRAWTRTFREAYFRIDEARYSLLTLGRMRDIEYSELIEEAMPDNWRAVTACCDPASDFDFEPGK